MATLAQLQARFLATLNRSDCDADQALDFIDGSFRRIQRLARLPSMERTASWTILSTDNALTLPPDYIEHKALTWNLRKLTRVSYDEYLSAVRCHRHFEPRVYCRYSGSFLVSAFPAVGDVVNLLYYGEFPPLADPSDQNDLSINAPPLILYGALKQAAVFFLDDREDKFEMQFQSELKELQNQADADEAASGNQAVRAPEGSCY